MSDYVFLDIETLPCATLEAVPEVRAPRTYKDPEKIAAYVAEHTVSAWRDTALNPLVGQLLCIGVAVNEGEPIALYSATPEGLPDEEAMLVALDAIVPDGAIWVGHRLAEFDLRWLYYRARKYGLPLAYKIPWEKWSKRVEDTAELAQGPNPRGDVPSLAALAGFFGIPGKPDGIDGGKVLDFYLAGRLPEILAYCASDVRMAREVHRALRWGLRNEGRALVAS